MAFTNSLVQVVCNATLQTWGGDIYVGVMTVLNSVRDIFTMPVHGLTTGASPVMSFNYGEKAYDRVKKAIKFITAVCVIYTLAGWGILKLMPEFIFSGSVLWLCSLPARVYLWHLEKQKKPLFFHCFEKRS